MDAPPCGGGTELIILIFPKTYLQIKAKGRGFSVR
jgi:hypothetical protein